MAVKSLNNYVTTSDDLMCVHVRQTVFKQTPTDWSQWKTFERHAVFM